MRPEYECNNCIVQEIIHATLKMSQARRAAWARVQVTYVAVRSRHYTRRQNATLPYTDCDIRDRLIIGNDTLAQLQVGIDVTVIDLGLNLRIYASRRSDRSATKGHVANAA